MFKKFGQGLPESLVDIVSGMMEAKADEPASPDAEAIARRKRLQALKDKQEDDAAETSYKKDNSVRKVAGSAYGGAKQKDDDVNEALKGNQHKIDANKNGKVDAHDFKLLRAKKKVDDDLVERSLTPDEEGEKERVVKGMKKSMTGFKSRYGKDAKSVMYATATKLAKEETEYEELVLDLREGSDNQKGKQDDVPFDPDPPKTGKSAVAGKHGYGASLVRHLARQGLKKAMKKETMMGKAGCTSEETDLEERIMTPGTGTSPDPLNARIGLSRSLKKPGEKDKAQQQLKTAIKSTVDNKEHGKSNLPEESVEESRGHKILATKLRQIDTMSSGIAPDHSINVQSAKDKIKDVSNTDKVEIVTQKDCTLTHPSTDVSHMDDKYELNKKKHGYGNVVHNEEVEELDEVSAELLGRYSDKASKEYNDPKTPERKKATRRAGLMLGYNKVKARANVPATYKEEAEQVDEVSKSQLQRYSTSKEVIKSSKYDKHFSDKQAKQSAHRDSKDKSGKSVFGMKEEIKLDETAALDQYIKSMGYDPLNMDKNKKVMFAKTNAFKNWAATRQEDLYDGGQKGTQDIDSHMSPGATARG
jgi:hypothetical protein